MGWFTETKENGSGVVAKAKALRQKAVRFEERRQAKELADARKRIKKKKEAALIKSSRSPWLEVPLKKKKQGRKLSRKSGIRLI